MRNLRNCAVALFLGCCAPLLIWVGAGCAFYQQRRQVSSLKLTLKDMVCAIDSDCPTGYVCQDGRCAPVTQ